MNYLSVCSGIEAATVAWHPLGWKASAFSEIERFPRAVLKHHYPDTPLHGDFTTIQGDEYGPVDLLVGGTPCQSFSVAGLRKGMDDPRGNLTLAYLALAERTRPDWLVWENVPGVLSSNGGKDFGAFLGGLAELGYGFAYRVLDAQYFGVPQRRRRVFVVGHSGGWRCAAAVLFERQSVSGDSPPSRQAGQGFATLLASGAGASRPAGIGSETDFCIPTYSIQERAVSENPDAGPQGKGFQPDVAYTMEARNKTQAIAFGWQNSAHQGDDVRTEQSPTLDKSKTPAVCFGKAIKTTPHQGDRVVGDGDVHPSLMAVRRITPREAERLQGFPDEYTRVPYRNKEPEDCPDGPRYKALGNSMAVPVMRWIGERVAMVEALDTNDELREAA